MTTTDYIAILNSGCSFVMRLSLWRRGEPSYYSCTVATSEASR